MAENWTVGDRLIRDDFFLVGGKKAHFIVSVLGAQNPSYATGRNATGD